MGRRLGKKRGRVTLAGGPALLVVYRDVIEQERPDAHLQASLVPVDVPDPYKAGATIPVFRNAGGDPLERLRQRGDINEAQYRAGKLYERDLELAEIGTVKAIDPTKEAVDGGRLPESLSEPQRRALARLKDAGQSMGLFAESVVRGVLASNVSPSQLAIARGFTTRREQLHYGWIFRLALEYLARVYGTAVLTSAARRKVPSWTA
jgi:hypothetical protein